MLYILDENKQAVEEPDVTKWGMWFSGPGGTSDNRRVGWTEIPYQETSIQVSTVFLGIDHSWRLQGKPVLFETMVFGPDEIVSKLAEMSESYDTDFPTSEIQERWHTWDEAVKGHETMVKFVQVALVQMQIPQ